MSRYEINHLSHSTGTNQFKESKQIFDEFGSYKFLNLVEKPNKLVLKQQNFYIPKLSQITVQKKQITWEQPTAGFLNCTVDSLLFIENILYFYNVLGLVSIICPKVKI